jgi:hypothetical protein
MKVEEWHHPVKCFRSWLGFFAKRCYWNGSAGTSCNHRCWAARGWTAKASSTGRGRVPPNVRVPSPPNVMPIALTHSSQWRLQQNFHQQYPMVLSVPELPPVECKLPLPVASATRQQTPVSIRSRDRTAASAGSTAHMNPVGIPPMKVCNFLNSLGWRETSCCLGGAWVGKEYKLRRLQVE